MQLKLLDFLIKDSPKTKLVLFVASIVCGIINALIVVILNFAAKGFDNPVLDSRLFIMFLLCIGFYYLCKRYITHRISDLVQTAIYDYRCRILSSIRDLRLLSYEEIGKAPILSVLSEKTEVIMQGAHRLADGVPALIMLICSFAYIASISGMAFLMTGICIALSVISSQIMLKSMYTTMQQAIEIDKEYLAYMQHVLDGFNELKMNRRKSDDLVNNYMGDIAKQSFQKNLETDICIVDLRLYSQNYFYLLMASIVFILPQISKLIGDQVMAITTIILYMLGPIATVLDMAPSLAKANVAVDFLKHLDEKLLASRESISDETELFMPPDYFEKLRISRVQFSYPMQNHSQRFSVGPIDLSINRGELVFIRGGNGSGKSTFLKLLTGLYEPDSGIILVDRQIIDPHLLTDYRNLFSIIFTDFHLFDRFYGIQHLDIKLINDYLVLMGLEEKTGYNDGHFTNINLSTGQKKRLALIFALIEDKAIYIFDEVAADQDPEFRQFFYDIILQKLKSRNKTVIVVTHDDKYFSHCDRLLIMEKGILREELLDKSA
jgi:putative ATP-binding cassette transporter